MLKQHVATAVASLAIAGMLVSPLAAFAQTSTSTSDIITNLLKQLQELQAKIADLQKQQQTLRQQQQAVVADLVSTLKEGDRGDNVKTLQAVLAADPNLYPEGLISGFYGRLTAAAVRRFQKKHGFEQVGNVGPKTLKKLRELLEDTPLALEDDDDSDDGDGDVGDNSGKRPCIPPGHLIAPGWLRKHPGATQQIVALCSGRLPPGISKKLPGTGTTTPPAPTPPPPPPPTDTAAPIISNVATSNIASTSATVTWNTNEAATSKVYYGTTSPLALGNAATVSDNILVLSHSLNVTGLATGTTYYYVAESKDAVNNAATSSQSSFATTP